MALITIQRNTSFNQNFADFADQNESNEEINYSLVDSSDHCLSQKSCNDCYIAVRGAAIILPHEECLHLYKSVSKNSSTNDIQKHLQSMFRLLRPEDTLKMAVKLESIDRNRTRYLIIVNYIERTKEESCLLGIDYNNEASIGLVLPVWADTRITLDGDGGFSITSYERHHIFKPVSVQAMWSALQALHKASAKSIENNYFEGGATHTWISYYEKRITFERSSYNEWHAMDDLIYKRPASPDLRAKPPEQVAIEQLIGAKLKEVMMAEDLDEVTSKYIRTKLEKELNKDLSSYKSYIDEEMIRILGQLDESSQIFDYLYLGSEWNASNFEELKGKGVAKILNVTKEIDNFFPGMFDYYNIRVYDDDSTEMLKYWDKTFKYIRKAKEEGSKVLVHCKKGISRSASVVLAFVMKETGWRLDQAIEYVKNRRNCIRPNSGFLKQLEIYEGILDASKQRHNSLWKSKSETNLVSKDVCLKRKSSEEFSITKNRINKQLNSKNDFNKENSNIENFLSIPGSVERPKSWSPEDSIYGELFPTNNNNINSNVREVKNRRFTGRQRFGTDPSCYNIVEAKKNMEFKSKHIENQILDTNKVQNINSPRISIVKDRITGFEAFPQSQVGTGGDALKANNSGNCGLVYSLANQFESTHLCPKNTKQKEVMTDLSNIGLQSKPPIPKQQVSADKLYPKNIAQENCDKVSKTQLIDVSKCSTTKSREHLIDFNKYYMKEDSMELRTTGDSVVPNIISTRRRLKENNLKRTTSYDSILKELSLSLFESQERSEPKDSKGHKRSASLYSHSTNWTALPSLPPLTSQWPSPDNRLSCCLSDRIESNRPSMAYMPHSKSMPSVIEAVNEVLWSTGVVMNSLIESIPNSKIKPNLESSVLMDCESSESQMQSKLSKSLNESMFSENSFSTKHESKVFSVFKKSYHLSRDFKTKNSEGVVKRLTEKIEAKVKGNKCEDSCDCDSHQSKSTPSSPNSSRNERPRSSTLNESRAEQKVKPLRKTSLNFAFKRIKSEQSFNKEIQSNQVFISEFVSYSPNSSNKSIKTSKNIETTELTNKTQTNSFESQIKCKTNSELPALKRAPQKKLQGKSHPLTRLMPQSNNSGPLLNKT